MHYALLHYALLSITQYHTREGIIHWIQKKKQFILFIVIDLLVELKEYNKKT